MIPHNKPSKSCFQNFLDLVEHTDEVEVDVDVDAAVALNIDEFGVDQFCNKHYPCVYTCHGCRCVPKQREAMAKHHIVC